MNPIVEGAAGNALWAMTVRVVGSILSWFLRFLKRKSPFKPTVLCLKHRTNARERYYEKAFSAGTDVLLITIMSQHSVKAIEPHLRESQRTNTALRVLTLHHETHEATVEALRRHLCENDANPKRTLDQVRQAAPSWRQLAGKFNNLTVREYRSVPTMQGLIVSNKWALVELLPYGAQPDERPALVLTPKTDPEAFELLRARFEQLWSDSEA